MVITTNEINSVIINSHLFIIDVFPRKGLKVFVSSRPVVGQLSGTLGRTEVSMSPWDEKMKEVPPQKQREGLMFYATVSRDPLFFPTVSIVRCFPVHDFLRNFRTRKSRDSLIQRLPWFLHGIHLFLLQNSYRKSDQRQEIIMTWGYAAYGERVNENFVLQISESFPVTSRQMFHGFGRFFARFGQMFSLCFFRMMWIMM